MSHGMHKPPPGSHAHGTLGDSDAPQVGQIHTLPEGSVLAKDGTTISWSQAPNGAVTAIGGHNEQLVVSRYRPSATAGTDILHGGDMATAPAASDPQNADPVDAGPKHPGHLAGQLAGHVGNIDTSDTSDTGEGADPIRGLQLVYGSDPYLTVTYVNDDTRQAFFVEVTGLLASVTFRGRTDGGNPTSVPVTVSARYRPHHQSLDWEGTLDLTRSPVQTIVLIPGWWLDAFKEEMRGASYFDPLAEVLWDAFAATLAPPSVAALGHGVIANQSDGGGMAFRAVGACVGGAISGATADPLIAPLAAVMGCVVMADLSMANDMWPDIRDATSDAWSAITKDIADVVPDPTGPDPDLPDPDPEEPDDGCFEAGTAVAVPDFRSIPIERIAVGDLVVSRAESSPEQGARRVTRTWRHQGQRTLDLRLETGERVRTTAPHRFFTLERGIVAAGELQVGERLQTLAGVPRAIINIEPGPAGATVYNLTVEDLHTYFVADAGVWVHNDKQTSHDDPPPPDDGSGDSDDGPDDDGSGDDGGTTPGGGSGSGGGSGPTPA